MKVRLRVCPARGPQYAQLTASTLQMAKRLMAEDEDEEGSSMAESADHSVDGDSAMDEDGVPHVNGVAH